MSHSSFGTNPVPVSPVSTKHRKIHTSIPSPGTVEILNELNLRESRSMHGQLPLVWDKAFDSYVYDPHGNQWIDFTSTIFVANVGHANPRIVEAIRQSIETPLLACYAYPNKTRSEYLAKLLEFAGPGFEKAFLLSAGTEATEAALKLMKMHGRSKGKRGNYVVGFSGNWHGRTLGAQVLSSNKNQKDWISDPTTETIHIDFPYEKDINASPREFLHKSLLGLEAAGISIADDICGFMLETFQGWGAFFYPTDYVKELRLVCDRNDILLAFDEMQAGFGRTGLNFGYEHYGVKADLLCCGKGMGGGLPLSGVIGSAAVMDLPEVGNMSSTHSGNPLMCAVGMAVLEELEEKDLVTESATKGEILHSGLNKLKQRYPKLIDQVNGKGLVAAIVFKLSPSCTVQTVSAIVETCFRKGLLVVHTGRESIKIGPPLTISEEALMEGIGVIEESIEEVLA